MDQFPDGGNPQNSLKKEIDNPISIKELDQ